METLVSWVLENLLQRLRTTTEDNQVLICPGFTWFQTPKSCTLGIPILGKLSLLGTLLGSLLIEVKFEYLGTLSIPTSTCLFLSRLAWQWAR